MARIVTELDIDLAKEQVKIAQIKADMKAVELAAKQVRIGENLVSAQASAEIAKVAALKEQLAKASFEASVKELAPQEQHRAIMERIVQLRKEAYASGPIRESEALRLDKEINALVERRGAILQASAASRERELNIERQQVTVATAQAAAAREQAGAELIRQRAADHAAMMSPFGSRGGSGPSAFSGANRFATANFAYQIQDIAVQAQQGVRFSTIFAQQGSQLASVFGPGGAIAGGMIAIAGAAIMMGQKNKDAFDALIKGAKDSREEINRLRASGSVPELTSGLGKAVDELDALKKGLSDAGSGMGRIGSFFGVLVGGDRGDVQRYKARVAIEEQEQAIAKAEKATIAAAESELEIVKLKAAGKEVEAGEMERQVKLARELETIKASKLTPDGKAALMNVAEDKAKVEGDAARQKDFTAKESKSIEQRSKEREEEAKREIQRANDVARAQSQLDEERQKALMEQLTPLEQIEAMKARALEVEKQTLQVGPLPEAEQLRLETQILELKNREAQIQNQITNEEARAAEQAANKLQHEQQQAQAKAKQQGIAAEDLLGEMKALELRAHHHTKAAEQQEKINRITKEARHIQDQLGVSKEDAMGIAKRIDDLQHPDHRGRIHGAKSPDHFGIANAQFPGLDKHAQMQQGHLRDKFQFPGLEKHDQLQQRHAQNNQRHEAAQHATGVSIMDAPKIEALLTQLIGKLDLSD